LIGERRLCYGAHPRRALVFLFFLSKNSVQLLHRMNEINFAYDIGKTVLAIHLEETPLPDGLRLMLGSTQTIRKHVLAPDVYRQQVLNALTRTSG
jgi:hypothetical protein